MIVMEYTIHLPSLTSLLLLSYFSLSLSRSLSLLLLTTVSPIPWLALMPTSVKPELMSSSVEELPYPTPLPAT